MKKKISLPANQKKTNRKSPVKSVNGKKKVPKNLLIILIILFISLFIFVFYSSKQQSLTGNAAQTATTLITPTFGVVGDCTTNNDCPTITTVPGTGTTITAAPTTTSSVTTSPCTTTANAQTTAMDETEAAKHKGGIIQIILQFLELLLQLLGELLGGNTTTPVVTQPTVTPAPTQSTTTPTGTSTTTPTSTPTPCPQSSTPTTVPTTVAAVTTAPTTTTSNFVTASSQQLQLNGKATRFIGFDFSADGSCWLGTNMTTAQMDSYFAALPANGMSRFFAPDDAGDTPALVESVVHEADKYNQHVIIALNDSNSDNGCDPQDEEAGGTGKTAAYYETAATAGSEYETWVASVVTPLANDPGVAIWEIANEPFHEGATITNGEVSQQVADTFVNDAATYIKSLDHNHLVSIASADIGDFGGTTGYQSIFTNLDVIDDHDYSWDYDNGAVVSGDFASEKQVAQNLNKPFMVDEAGVEGGTGCTSATPADSAPGSGLSLPARVTYLTDKANDYLSTTGAGGAGGASAIVFWDYEDATEGNCTYQFLPGDPMLTTVQNYTLPN